MTEPNDADCIIVTKNPKRTGQRVFVLLCAAVGLWACVTAGIYAYDGMTAVDPAPWLRAFFVIALIACGLAGVVVIGATISKMDSMEKEDERAKRRFEDFRE